jgi:hypothetical protein
VFVVRCSRHAVQLRGNPWASPRRVTSWAVRCAGAPERIQAANMALSGDWIRVQMAMLVTPLLVAGKPAMCGCSCQWWLACILSNAM